MGFYPRLARSFGLVLIIASGTAHASELMRMPFDCRFDGAQIHLRPTAEDRTYTVIGNRQREVFTTCSPDEPDRCRSWLVHRFQFDCDGDRVAWLDAAAAATRFADWDAWSENGSFRMRMDRLWGVARARGLRASRRTMRRRDFEDERDPFEAPDDHGYGARVVTLPPGFAPAVGIPLTFEGGSPEVAELPDAPAPQAPAVAAYQSQPVPAPHPDVPERAPPPQQRLAAPPPVTAPAPQPATSSWATEPKPEPPAAAPTHKQAAATDVEATEPAVAAPQEPQGPTIINGPRPVVAAPASPTTPATTSPQSAIAAARIETSAVAAPVDLRAQAAKTSGASSDITTSAEATPAPQPPPVPSETSSESEAPPVLGLPGVSIEAAAAGAATTLVLAGLAVFGFLRWRGRPQSSVLQRGDIADISLGGGFKGLTHERAPDDGSDAPAASPRSSETARSVSEASVPTTYDEALEVLGASPESSTVAIKKIVDGLRQSWHPDLARSETDRLQREARVRQINVAWDLVSQRRSAA